MNKKKRRHSGYVSPHATISKKLLIKYSLFVNDFYDDWENYRDGLRDWSSDFKKIKKFIPKWTSEEFRDKRKRMNLKQKYLLIRRERRKRHPRNK